MNALPYTWRISKYDPALRNAQGYYLADDWTFFAQVGQSFNGRQLTYKDYVSVESAYVRSAMLFLADAGLALLEIAELQSPHVAPEVSSRLQDITYRKQDITYRKQQSRPGHVIGAALLCLQLPFQQQGLGVFDQLLDADEEADGLAAIYNAVVIREGDVHHRADDDLAV